MSSPRWVPFNYVQHDKDNVRNIVLGQYGQRAVLHFDEPVGIANEGGQGSGPTVELSTK